jgi:hypothetical protein
MAIPYLSNIDLQQNEIQNAVVHNQASNPSTPVAGQIYFNTGTNKLLVYDGSAWLDTTGDLRGITDGDGISGGVTSGTATLSVNADTTNDFQFTSGVLELKDIITAGSTGSSTAIPVITYDATGRITAVTTAAISTEFTLTDGTNSQTIAGGDTLTVSSTDEIEVTVSATDTLTIGHADVSRTNNTSTATPAAGGNFTAIDSITTNARGHVTAVNTKTVTLPDDVDVSVANLITRLGEISDNVTIGDAADVTVIIPGNLQVTGTTTTNNVETVSTSNGVVFEGNAADANELTLLAGTLTADRTLTLPDKTGTVATLDDISSNSYAETITDTDTVTHTLNTRDVIVQLFDTVTFETVYADVVRTDASNIDITFGSTPTNSIRVLVAKIG